MGILQHKSASRNSTARVFAKPAKRNHGAEPPRRSRLPLILLLVLGIFLPTAHSARTQPAGSVALELYFSDVRKDNFTTSTAQGAQDARSSGYRLVRTEGYVLTSPQPGTAPLKLFWSPTRGDNFTTATAEGERDALGAGYVFVRVEGYIYTSQVTGTNPLKLFWSDVRTDNFTTATADGERDALVAGYRFVRDEGYVISSGSAAPGPPPPVTSDDSCKIPPAHYEWMQCTVLACGDLKLSADGRWVASGWGDSPPPNVRGSWQCDAPDRFTFRRDDGASWTAIRTPDRRICLEDGTNCLKFH